MAKTPIKIEFCTCCGSQDIKAEGNKFYCPACDVTYKVTEAGTTVVDPDPLGKEKARIDQNTADIAELKGKPAEPAEPEPKPAVKVVDDNDDDDDDEQEGFINW